MKMENRKTYQYFKNQLEELLAQGFSRERAFLVLKKIHNSINDWQGYRYTHVSKTAGESLEYLICQVDETEAYEIWQHRVIENQKNNKWRLNP